MTRCKTLRYVALAAVATLILHCFSFAAAAAPAVAEPTEQTVSADRFTVSGDGEITAFAGKQQVCAISGNTDSYMNKSGKGGMDKLLATSTKWVALVWIVLTFALCLLNAAGF